MAAQAELVYRHAGTVLIRATTDPGGLALPEDLDLFGDGDSEAESARAWLAQVWRRGDVREAIHLASPVLAGQVDEVMAGRKPDARAVRRIVVSLASYLLRWQGRAAPFGLFAGVAVVTVGGQPVARWGGHRVVARADAQWLGALVDRLERCPGLRERLPVVANGSAFVRGDRLVVPGLPRDARSGRFAALEVSVRLTRPVRAALEAAGAPVAFGELVKVVSGDFPSVSPQRVGAMLAELVAQGVLVTGLRAPMTVVLAQSLRRGIIVDGHLDAINTISTWLDTWRHDADPGPWWPQWITRDQLRTGHPSQQGPLRPSWCYGTPGLARAQQIAAIATSDTRSQQMAEHALAGVLSDPAQLGRITGTSLCHGWAGLYQTVWRAARDALTPTIGTSLPHLAEHLTRHSHTATRSADTGLLEGDAGAALALHTAAHAAPPVSGWDTCLLIN